MTPVKVFSTVKLTEKTPEYVSLFTVPQGQMMPGTYAPEVAEMLTPEHTNIMRAGEFGSAIGDVLLDRVRAFLTDESVRVEGQFKLYVSGMKMFEAPLEQMLAGLDIKHIPVARTDMFEGRIYLATPVKSPVYVRVEFGGTMLDSVRCSRCGGTGSEP